jgi:hypothetical protein
MGAEMDQKQQWPSQESGRPQNTLKQRASSEAERVRANLAEKAAPIKEQARGFAEKQKQAGAEQIGGVARAVHGVAAGLENELPFAAPYVREAAAKLESASDALKQKSVDDLAKSIGDFARAQPVAFLGGAVLAGFVLARFLKSSAEPAATAGGREHAAAPL